MIKALTYDVPLTEEELSRLNDGQRFNQIFWIDGKKIIIHVYKDVG